MVLPSPSAIGGTRSHGRWLPVPGPIVTSGVSGPQAWEAFYQTSFHKIAFLLVFCGRLIKLALPSVADGRWRMDSEPFPGCEPDHLGPEDSRWFPAGRNGPVGEVPEGAEQGLHVCLPAEELTLDGFCQNGRADTMAPGPLLATVLHAVVGEDGSGLAQLSEDQLIGVISAARRLESRMAWTEMAAMAEFAARQRGREFAADELAAEFRQPWPSGPGARYATSAGAAEHRDLPRPPTTASRPEVPSHLG